MSDIGSTGGPALLSAVTAALSLAAGIVVHRRCSALAAAAVLWYWIPRTERHPAR